MPAKIIAGRSKDAIGIRGKNNIINKTKMIESTTVRIKTDGINITSTTAMMTNAKYVAIYPPMLVTCLPFMVIVVPVIKWIADTSSNMPSTINSIFFFFIVVPLAILPNVRGSRLAKLLQWQVLRLGIDLYVGVGSSIIILMSTIIILDIFPGKDYK
jgi:hypothetical protein